MMHSKTVLSVLLAAANSVVRAQLLHSGVYNLVVEGSALAGGSSPNIAGQVQNRLPSQAWSVVYTPVPAGSASLQNVDTKTFIAPLDEESVTLSSSAFLWQVMNVGEENTMFCSDGLCLDVPGALYGITGSTAVLSPRNVSAGTQLFRARGIAPPPATYQIQHISTDTVLGANSVPSTASIGSGPAVFRSQLWTIGIDATGSNFTLKNAHSGGFLSLASNETIGTFSDSETSFWNIAFVSDTGIVIRAPNAGYLSVLEIPLSLEIATTGGSYVAWNFIPADPSTFLR